MNIRIDRTRVFIALPLAVIVMAAAIALYIPFDRAITDAEMEVLDFRPAALKILRKTIISGTTKRKGPFDFAEARPLHVNDLPHEQQKPETNVSLIVISGENKMAVINGRTVKEGDSIRGMRIAKIESDRILVQDRSAQWVYLKEEP